jgi:aromatic ring hydroxylase
VTLPFEDEFYGEETKKDLEKYIVRNANISPEDSHRIWRLIENVGASPMAHWYEIAGVHGGGSPIMETVTLNAEYDYEAKKNIARYLAGIKEDLDQSKELNRKPSSW